MTIKIAGVDYNIKNLGISEMSGDLGRFAPIDNAILLYDKLCHAQKEQTLIHEIMHCLFWNGGFCHENKPVKDCEEQLVKSLSCGIYEVLKNNKGVLNEYFNTENEIAEISPNAQGNKQCRSIKNRNKRK